MDELRFGRHRYAGAGLAHFENQRQVELVRHQQLDAFARERLEARGRDFNYETARCQVGKRLVSVAVGRRVGGFIVIDASRSDGTVRDGGARFVSDLTGNGGTEVLAEHHGA